MHVIVLVPEPSPLPLACKTGPDRRSTGVLDLESSIETDASDLSRTPATAK